MVKHYMLNKASLVMSCGPLFENRRVANKRALNPLQFYERRTLIYNLQRLRTANGYAMT